MHNPSPEANVRYRIIVDRYSKQISFLDGVEL